MTNSDHKLSLQIEPGVIYHAMENIFHGVIIITEAMVKKNNVAEE